MLIDDEPGVIFALKLMLEALNCEVSPFEKGLEAINFLKSESNFSYILCDLRMPELDGFEVLRLVKEIAPEIPFILISGHATSEDVAIAKGLGSAGFLGKPFTVDQLKGALKI